MSETATLTRPTAQTTGHFDVLIVGAGISGVGAAYHLTKQCPGKSFVVLEALDHFGGTWWTHNYPGIRSDSDLHTFGYRFKPWTSAPIATAQEILTYMGEVIEDNGLARHIRYQHKIATAGWSGKDNLWTIEATRTDTNEPVRFTANFLWMCQGYYRHSVGYTPEWDGMASFKGQIVHPQTWPENLDYKGKNVVVIGSGATAATLVPAMAPDCGHVTMLQRSPTYFRTGRNAIALAEELRALGIQEEWIHEIVRKKILLRARRVHPPLASPNPRRSSRNCWARCRRSSGRTTMWRPISPPATGRGGSASPSCRTPTCSRESAQAKPRS